MLLTKNKNKATPPTPPQTKNFLFQIQMKKIKISETKQTWVPFLVLTRQVPLDKSPPLLLRLSLNSPWSTRPCVTCPFQSHESPLLPLSPPLDFSQSLSVTGSYLPQGIAIPVLCNPCSFCLKHSAPSLCLLTYPSCLSCNPTDLGSLPGHAKMRLSCYMLCWHSELLQIVIIL